MSICFKESSELRGYSLIDGVYSTKEIAFLTGGLVVLESVGRWIDLPMGGGLTFSYLHSSPQAGADQSQ
jgi:hypothetical protein